MMIVQRKGSILSNLCQSNKPSAQISASESCQRATQTPNMRICNYHPCCCTSSISSLMKCSCRIQDVDYNQLKLIDKESLSQDALSTVIGGGLCLCAYCPQTRKASLVKHRYCLQRYILNKKQTENPPDDSQKSQSRSCPLSSLRQSAILDQIIAYGKAYDKNQIILEIGDADVEVSNEDVNNIGSKDGDMKILRLSRTSSQSPNRNSDENLFHSEIDLNLIPLCCQYCHLNSHSITLLYDATQTSTVQQRCKRSITNSVGDYFCNCPRCVGCCCALHMPSTTCTSTIDSPTELPQIPETALRRAFMVSAECHRNSISQQSNESDGNGSSIKENSFAASMPTGGKDESNSSTSRCSSISRSTSFCSCNSSSYCYYGSSYADSSLEHMNSTHKSKTTKEFLENNKNGMEDDQNSSTLTPPTNASSLVSTPLTEYDDLNTPTANKSLSDDNTSLSQSAEYYSLSSSTQASHATPKRSIKLEGNQEDLTPNETAALDSYL